MGRPYVLSAENIFGRSIVQHGSVDWHRFAFYNVGLNANSKKEEHSRKGIVAELSELVNARNLDGLGLCEVFNLRDPASHSKRRKEILDYLL